jgi:hypothetical protein
VSTTKKPQISIRFRDREQIELIKRAADHRLIPFNTFVREAAQQVAQKVLDTPGWLDLLNQNGNPPSIPSSTPPNNASILLKQNPSVGE